MPKRPETVDTLLLSIELLRRIPRGRKVTASELHRQLKDAGMERDLRSIQRLLDTLSGHLDIERDDRSKPYGYRWLENARALAVPTLTRQESLLLLLAEEHLKHLLPARLMKSMEVFFGQARRNLSPDSHAHLEKQWPEKVRVVAASQPLLPPRIHPQVFDAVSEALYGNHWLRLSYRNPEGKQHDAKVMPLGLVQQGLNLYLVCRYEGFHDERNLALHRILKAETLTLTFSRPGDFTLARYEADGRFAFGEGKRIQLSFRIECNAGRHLKETPLSTDQVIRELRNGQLAISATVVDSAMLDWWLRGFGENVSAVRKKPTPPGQRGHPPYSSPSS